MLSILHVNGFENCITWNRLASNKEIQVIRLSDIYFLFETRIVEKSSYY